MESVTTFVSESAFTSWMILSGPNSRSYARVSYVARVHRQRWVDGLALALRYIVWQRDGGTGLRVGMQEGANSEDLGQKLLAEDLTWRAR